MMTKTQKSKKVATRSLSQVSFFDNLIWLTTEEVAIYLRKFKSDGSPSVGSVRNLVYRGKIRARKFAGTLYFNRKELDRLIETSELKGVL